jgi:hypothetical protein
MKLFASKLVKGVLLLGILVLSNNLHAQDDLIKIGEVTNEIRMGQLAGNRNLTFGITNILEELLMDTDYSLTPQAEQQINIKLVFFDIKNIGTNIGVFHKDVSITQIIAIGELQKGKKVKKKTIQKGESKEISTSTLVVAEDGTFNQQTASIALKKVLVQIVEELLK